MSIAFLFPGQGSQFVGMGRELAEAFPEARAVFEEADDALGFSLSELMWSGDEEELKRTKNAQPALLTHGYAAHRVVCERFGDVSFAAGHSLGEFTAHVAAGTLTFGDALLAVRRRGELMFAAGEAREGTMAALLGLDDEAVEAVCDSVEEGVCVPANFNSAGQVVISGDVEGVREGMERAKEAGAKRAIELNVSGAFHSPLMEPAVAGLREHLEGIEFRDAGIPVVSNVTTDPVDRGSVARDLLVQQLTAPVRWRASVAVMHAEGVETFVELGPGSVLAGLNRRNARGANSVSIGEPADLEKLDALVG